MAGPNKDKAPPNKWQPGYYLIKSAAICVEGDPVDEEDIQLDELMMRQLTEVERADDFSSTYFQLY